MIIYNITNTPFSESKHGITVYPGQGICSVSFPYSAAKLSEHNYKYGDCKHLVEVLKQLQPPPKRS